MLRGRLTFARSYVALVTAAGFSVLGVLLAVHGDTVWRVPSAAEWLFAALVFFGELWPFKVRRRDEDGEVTTSTTFALALLLAAGTPTAALALGAASVVADLWRHKPPSRVAFNVAQYTLSLAVGGLILGGLSGPPAIIADLQLSFGDVPRLMAAGAAIFLVNNSLAAVAIALAGRLDVSSVLRSDFAFNASTAGVMLSLAPVLVSVSRDSLPLIPMVLITVVALYKSTRVSLEKEHEALHDLLTGLPNRRLFTERAEESLYHAKAHGSSCAVLLVDLDRFKEINDSLGHHVGDLVLQHVAGRLRASVREVDTVSRLGGDEFAVLLPSVADPTVAVQLADRMLASLDTAVNVEGFPLDINASIGIAMHPEHGDTVPALLQRADEAMYAAKKSSRGQAVFNTDGEANGRGRLSLLGQLRSAIDRGQLLCHYQPICDMRTGQVRGVEALVRWQHPQHGLIYPDDFIPLAEHTDLIGPLTANVLDMSLRQLRSWHQAGYALTVAVNLSVANLYDIAFPREVARALAKWQVAPGWLELEITENTVMADPLRAMGVLNELSDMGVRIAIDDFGTGYSSLVHLKHLPVNEIKVDRSFVMHMANDADDAVIVRSIIELARNLGLRVVAEGVENEEVCAILADLGCDLAQGYFLNRPQPAQDFTRWLGEHGAGIDTPALTRRFRMRSPAPMVAGAEPSVVPLDPARLGRTPDDRAEPVDGRGLAAQ